MRKRHFAGKTGKWQAVWFDHFWGLEKFKTKSWIFQEKSLVNPKIFKKNFLGKILKNSRF